MSKKPMTWMDVIKEQLAKFRSEGKTPSIGDVTPEAKKEWTKIKAGTHPLYSQGSSKGKGSMKKGSMKKGSMKKGSMKKGSMKKGSMKKGSMKMGKHNKTQKMMPSQDPKEFVKQMLTKIHLCKKDSAKIYKYLSSQKGGSCGSCEMTSGGSSHETGEAGPKTGGSEVSEMTGGGAGPKTGGKKSKKQKKMKGGYVQIESKDGLLDGSEETDAKKEEVERVEGPNDDE
jgi:hypothetical protein